MNQRTSTRSLNVDIIRVIAILMIIVIHTVLNFTYRKDFFPSKVWFLAEAVSAVSKTGVLLFFMLSGFLVISKTRSIKENLQKTVARIAIPLIFFTLVHLLYSGLIYGDLLGVNAKQWLFAYLAKLIDFPNSSLWFLVVLLFCYLLNPLWQEIFALTRKRDLALYITGLSLILMIITGFIQNAWPQRYTLFNFFTAWLSYLFFYLYGGLVKNNWFVYQKKRLNIIMIFSGYVLTIIFDYLSMVRHAAQPGSLQDSAVSASIPLALLAMGLFNLLISGQLKITLPPRLRDYSLTALRKLADLSYGIYLNHLFVVGILLDKLGFGFDFVHISFYLYLPLYYLLVLGISALLTYLIQKTPALRHVIGE